MRKGCLKAFRENFSYKPLFTTILSRNVPRGTWKRVLELFVGFPQSPVENVDNFLVSCGYVIEFSTGGVENMDPKELWKRFLLEIQKYVSNRLSRCGLKTVP